MGEALTGLENKWVDALDTEINIVRTLSGTNLPPQPLFLIVWKYDE